MRAAPQRQALAILLLLMPCAWAGLALDTPLRVDAAIISGSGAPPGAGVELFVNDVSLGWVRAGGEGRFVCSVPALKRGDYVHARCSLSWDMAAEEDHAEPPAEPGMPIEDWRTKGRWSVANADRSVEDGALVLRAHSDAPVVLSFLLPEAFNGAVHRVLEVRARATPGATRLRAEWELLNRSGVESSPAPSIAVATDTMETRAVPMRPMLAEDGGPVLLRLAWDARPSAELRVETVRLRELLSLDFTHTDDTNGLGAFSGVDVLGVQDGMLTLRPTDNDPHLIFNTGPETHGLLDPEFYSHFEIGGVWQTNLAASPVQIYWRDCLRADGADGFGVAGNMAESPEDLLADGEGFQRLVFPVAGYREATWRVEDGPVSWSSFRVDPMVYPALPQVMPEDRIYIDYIRLRPKETYGPSPTVVVGAAEGAPAPLETRPRTDAPVGPPPEPLRFTVDMSARAGDCRVLRLVDNVTSVKGWKDAPLTEPAWGLKRWEGVILEMAGWMALSSHDPANSLHTVDTEGRYVFKPSPGTRAVLDEWVLGAGLRPNIAMGTPTMPWPLVAGGFKVGQYNYQIRQPNDYEAWRFYLESMFQWLIDTYGRDEVKTWTFLFGIESDWQAKAVYPETGEEMNEADNRREFMKTLDYFHAAAAAKLGPTVYVGCYFAFVTQADDYVRHWGEGTNFATGETGTRIGWCGFSDWYILNLDRKNPFSRAGMKRRRGNVGNTWSAGLLWKYEHLENLLAPYPALRGLEIGLPECGFFDTAGAINPRTGAPAAADVAYTDHRGTALRSIRNVAYAECPRLAFAKMHTALGTGDMGIWSRDTAKAPVFHALRFQRGLAGCRPLAVARTGREQRESNDVRLLAAATDGPTLKYRLLLTNFNERFSADAVEPVPIRLENLPPVPELEVTVYRVDATHNNWWREWKAYREAEGIPYVAGRNHSHLGSNLRYADKYVAWHNDVNGTLREEDIPKWRAWAAEHAEEMPLRPTGAPLHIPVVDGVAELQFGLPAHGTVWLEVRHADTAATLPRRLRGGPGAWDTARYAAFLADGGRDGGPAKELRPAGGGAGLSTTISGLVPGAVYTFAAWARASGRVMDYALYAVDGTTGERVTAWGDYSARWNRLAASARADARGRLEIGLTAPEQPCDAQDAIRFSDLEVLRTGWRD